VAQDINIKGTFIATKAFLKHTGTSPSAPTTIINISSLAALGNPPGQVAYSASKLAVVRFTAFLNFEYPDITSISMHPGIVPTDMGLSVPYLAIMMKDTPELCGGAAVWLSNENRSYLSGRLISVNWDVEELERRKEEIQKENLLTIMLNARLGGPDVVLAKPGKALTND
jgi:NAD(P)-dependent dehydrogenase (short-subunit alcohol dehydrogenase family)